MCLMGLASAIHPYLMRFGHEAFYLMLSILLILACIMAQALSMMLVIDFLMTMKCSLVDFCPALE